MASRVRCAGWIGALALLALMVGCSQTHLQSIAIIRQAFDKSRLVNPTPDAVAARPYFQLQASSPDGMAILILGGVEGDLQAWYGQGGQAIFLDHGVVVRTIGLVQNLDDTHWPSVNPFIEGLHKLTSTVETVRLVDWSPGYRYGVIVHDRLTSAGMEDVSILGTIHHLRRIDEQLDTPGFSASNHYWMDPVDGFIWKSHQVIAPGLPLDLVQLRPYRGAAQ